MVQHRLRVSASRRHGARHPRIPHVVLVLYRAKSKGISDFAVQTVRSAREKELNWAVTCDGQGATCNGPRGKWRVSLKRRRRVVGAPGFCAGASGRSIHAISLRNWVSS
eukprot:2147486-Rhodomonas_salina.1